MGPLDDRQRLIQEYKTKKPQISQRMNEFRETFRKGDRAIFAELCFCIFTAGASARMGLSCIDAIEDIILTGTAEELESRLTGKHRYPRARSGYIVHTRNYLETKWKLRMTELLNSFDDPMKRRDFFAANKGIKGIGYKEASHFLRNIGFKGYAILDKHILRSLNEFGVIENSKPPTSRMKYLEIESKMVDFARQVGIDFDDLDLLLWSNKTGEILK